MNKGFPWVKILGKRNHIVIFTYLRIFEKSLRNIFENEDVDMLCKTITLCKTLFIWLK